MAHIACMRWFDKRLYHCLRRWALCWLFNSFALIASINQKVYGINAFACADLFSLRQNNKCPPVYHFAYYARMSCYWNGVSSAISVLQSRAASGRKYELCSNVRCDNIDERFSQCGRHFCTKVGILPSFAHTYYYYSNSLIGVDPRYCGFRSNRSNAIIDTASSCEQYYTQQLPAEWREQLQQDAYFACASTQHTSCSEPTTLQILIASVSIF